MFILIGVEGSDGKVYRPDPYDIRKEIPEVATYFEVVTKRNRLLYPLDKRKDYSSDDYAYVLLPPQIQAIPNDETELFHSIEEFQNVYKLSSESIYIVPSIDDYGNIISICDIAMISSVNKVPESTIEYNDNIFDMTGQSLELISDHGYKYYHSVYTKRGMESVLSV